MACKECGKPKCTCGKDRCSSPAAIQINNTETVLFRKVSIPAAAGDETTNPPKPGAFCNALVFYEATGATFLYSSDGIPTRIDADVSGLETKINDEIGERKAADQEIWTEIETIEASSDVVDVVGTYAALQAYDTSKLHKNDLVKVLQDETRDDAITYYRWSGTAFTYVGAEGPYYTASETDTLLADKQDKLIAGTGISIASDGKTISATATSANTIFYMNSSESGSTRHIYKNPNMTGQASSQDVFDANELGQVILRISNSATPDQYSDCYLQNAYKATGDYQLLFLDERTYRSFDTTNLSDTSFYYSTRVLQTEISAGANIQINGTTISATDTTYSNFVGTDGMAAGAAGLVPAPATTDDGKFLKSDGTWAAVSGGAGGKLVAFALDPNDNSKLLFYSDRSCTTQITDPYNDVFVAAMNGEHILLYDAINGGPGGYEYTYLVTPEWPDDDAYLYVYGLGYESSALVPDPNSIMVFELSSGHSFGYFRAGDMMSFQSKLTAGTNISINNNTISMSASIPVLYGSQGQNTDGAVTQKLFTDTVGDVETILQILNSGNGV